jgi:outer membrane protein OmpA-like peptidoglycan-associated protein
MSRIACAILVLLVSGTAQAGKLHVGYDIDHLDLDRHVLEFTLTRPAASAELVVIGEDGAELATASATYRNEPPGTWLRIAWVPRSSTRAMVLRLRAVAADGQAVRVELVPWSVAVDHEDVNFATDSAVIEPGEEAKLDASLARIREVVGRSRRFLKMKLYVAGHTDTVGPRVRNRRLSSDRARAIATYFRRKGLELPIAVAGFGEDVLKVETPDSTDERANRRADYVIGPASGPPPFRGAYRKARASWQSL